MEWIKRLVVETTRSTSGSMVIEPPFLHERHLRLVSEQRVSALSNLPSAIAFLSKVVGRKSALVNSFVA
jgi:hypothetical protein